MQKRSVFYSCLICGMLIIAVCLIGNRLGKEVIVYAEDYEQLQLYVSYDSNMEKINIWKNENGYYFFLPSNVDGQKIKFGNLQEDALITVGNNAYSSNDNILETVECNVTHKMQLNIDGNLLEEKDVVFVQSATLPTIYIETESGSLETIHAEKGVKEKAYLTILDEEGNLNYGNDIEYIYARGNSTFLCYDKKAYQIKLFSKSSLLGMDKAKKWLLLANAQDVSLLRNKLIFDFTTEHTELPSIDGVYADMYVNGNYVGNYYLCEKPEVGEKRLQITDLEEQNEAVNSKDQLQNGVQYISKDGKIRAVAGLNNPDDITGGYLLEKIIEGEYEETRSAFITEGGFCYRVASPENATVEQVEYICNLFNEMELAIGQKDGINSDTGKHFSEYLDVDSWVMKYLIEEVFSNPDAPAASIFFYKDSDAVDPLIYSGPVWDYDRTLGGYATHSYFHDDPAQIGNRGVYASSLLKHEEVYEAVIRKYEDVFVTYVEDELRADIASIQSEIRNSAEMNYVRWPDSTGYYTDWENDGEYIVSFMEKRIAYLNDVWLQLEQYHTVTFLDYYGNVAERYNIKHGEYMQTVPAIATYVALFNGWQSTSTGKMLDTRRPVLEDEIYRSTWIDMSILLQNGLGAAEINADAVDLEALEWLVEEIRKSREVQP